MGKYLWPEVFTDVNFDYDKEYPEEKIRKATAIADGLTGWGNCMAGGDIPENFGKSMVKIGKILNIVTTPDNLMSITI